MINSMTWGRASKVSLLSNSNPPHSVLITTLSWHQEEYNGGLSSFHALPFHGAPSLPYASSIDIAENLGNRGWKWDELLPHFKASETLVPPASKEWALEHGATYDPQFHGESGPLQRGFVPWLGASHVPFFKAMNSLGVPTNADSVSDIPVS